MALSGKYGKVDIPKIGEDEPVFILRAQDKLAEPAIEMYRSLTASHSSPLAEVLQKEIDAFRRWSGPKKMPD
jgi:hypothetical protein